MVELLPLVPYVELQSIMSVLFPTGAALLASAAAVSKARCEVDSKAAGAAAAMVSLLHYLFTFVSIYFLTFFFAYFVTLIVLTYPLSYLLTHNSQNRVCPVRTTMVKSIKIP